MRTDVGRKLKFYVWGELIKSTKGEKVPGAIMRGWWECKMKCPELFEQIHVWQEPSANQDEVTMRSC